MKTLSEIGFICKSARERKGRTQAEVAMEYGCTPANVSAFERGLVNNALLYLYYWENILTDIERRKIFDDD